MNNPLLMAVQNPRGFISEIMQDSRYCNDPRIRKASQLIQNNDTEGLKTLAENMCREYDTTPQQVAEYLQKQFSL